MSSSELRSKSATTRALAAALDRAWSVVDAYRDRFETGAKRLFGPIDEEIIALEKALTAVENSGGSSNTGKAK